MPSHHNNIRSRGFTLVECLIGVTVASLLAATTAQSYQDYLQRSHRANARTTLLQTARWMESVATATGAYPTVRADNRTVTMPGARYSLSATSADGKTYTLVATPLSAQTTDGCGSLVIDHADQRGVRHARVSAAECWPR